MNVAEHAPRRFGAAASEACRIIGGEAQKVASPSIFPAPLSVPERGWG